MKIKDHITPENWCKYYIALTKENQPVDPRSPIACRRCLSGWLNYCYNFQESAILVQRIYQYIEKGESISSWNDHPKRNFNEIKKLVEELDI